MARAATVADFLIQRKQLEPQRVATMGFGEYRPIQSNDSSEGRQKNRRVEIILGTMAAALNNDT
jgi:chemotaxis protein MotB